MIESKERICFAEILWLCLLSATYGTDPDPNLDLWTSPTNALAIPISTDPKKISRLGVPDVTNPSFQSLNESEQLTSRVLQPVFLVVVQTI